MQSLRSPARIHQMHHIPFSELDAADLIVDAVYEADPESKNFAGEPLARLTGTGNQGGFRFSGPVSNPNVVVLYSTMDEIGALHILWRQ
jgi:hypothetical protein